MALTLYHAEPVANSLKCLAALHEKDCRSRAATWTCTVSNNMSLGSWP